MDYKDYFAFAEDICFSTLFQFLYDQWFEETASYPWDESMYCTSHLFQNSLIKNFQLHEASSETVGQQAMND